MNFAVGGNAGDVITAIRDYGIVPTEIYEGLNYGTQKPHFNEIDAVLKAYVDAIIAAPNKTLTTAWQNGLNGILDAYFGQMPGDVYIPRQGVYSQVVRRVAADRSRRLRRSDLIYASSLLRVVHIGDPRQLALA